MLISTLKAVFGIKHFLYRFFLLFTLAVAQYEVKPHTQTHTETRIVVSNYNWILLVYRNLTGLDNEFNNNNLMIL